MSLDSLLKQLEEIKLVVVSKGRPVEQIKKLYERGIRDFGENRVQEALEKIDTLPSDIRWHFIGKLQKNKVTKVVGRFHLIHSVDSVELAEKLARVSAEQGVVSAILLEANTSGEVSKSGLSPSEWEAHFEKIIKLPALDVQGLMTMAPFTEDEEVIRRAFAALRQLGEHLGLAELSMGMSHDYTIAIEEGATIVRIGTAIFDGLR